MSSRLTGELAEGLVLRVDGLDARQVQQRIEQHRRMADREHEAIAVWPDGIVRIEPQMPLPQRVGDRRQGHGRAGVARVGLLDRVHRQRADGVDTESVEIGRRQHEERSYFARHLRETPSPESVEFLRYFGGWQFRVSARRGIPHWRRACTQPNACLQQHQRHPARHHAADVTTGIRARQQKSRYSASDRSASWTQLAIPNTAAFLFPR